MRRFLLFSFLALFIQSALVFQLLHAQSQTEQYQKVTYYQVQQDGLHLFLDGVEAWKQEHHNHIGNNENSRVAWRLYRVPFSSSASAWYNFVTIEISSGLNSLQTPDRPTLNSLRRVKDHEIKLSYAVHSEIWKTEAQVYGDGNRPSRYLNANFMYAMPGSLADYLELETKIAAPLHQNQADNDRMDTWNFYRLVFPTGTMTAYNFITADYYASLEQIEMGITPELIERVHPDMDVDEFEDFANSIRERVWSDLWELLEFVD